MREDVPTQDDPSAGQRAERIFERFATTTSRIAGHSIAFGAAMEAV